MKIGHPKDFWSGIMFIAAGLLFAVVAHGIAFGDTVLVQGYAMGTAQRMGPAYFPFWLGVLLIVLGIAIAIQGVRTEGGPEGAFPKFHWRPILFVLGAVILFGVILRPVGMLISGIVLVFVSSMGNPDGMRFKPTLILALALVTFCALVFVWGLKLPIPLCPAVEAVQANVPFCRF